MTTTTDFKSEFCVRNGGDPVLESTHECNDDTNIALNQLEQEVLRPLLEADPLAVKPLETVILAPLDNTSSNVKMIHYIFFERHPQGSRKLMVAKFLAAAVAYSATYSFIAADKKVSENRTFQVLFAAGDILAWGTLTAWSARNIIQHISDGQHIRTGKRKNACIATIYWIAVIGLGLCSALPTAYNTYYYNEGDLFWTFYTPFVLSIFSMLSLDELLQRIVNTDNPLTRRIRKSEALQCMRAQDHLCKIVQNSIKSSSDVLARIQASTDLMLVDKNIKVIVKDALFLILKDGLNQRLTHKKNNPTHWQTTKKVVLVFGGVVALGSPLCDSISIYKGYQLLLKNQIGLPFVIAAAVLPGIYLQVNIVQKFSAGIVKKISDKLTYTKDNLQQVALTVVKMIPLFLITAFGLGAYSIVAHENMQTLNVYDFFKNLFLVAAVATMVSILLSSLVDMSQEIIQAGRACCGQLRNKDTAHRLSLLREYLSQISHEELQTILKDIDIPGLNIEALQNKLSSTSDVEVFLQALEANNAIV